MFNVAVVVIRIGHREGELIKIWCSKMGAYLIRGHIQNFICSRGKLIDMLNIFKNNKICDPKTIDKLSMDIQYQHPLFGQLLLALCVGLHYLSSDGVIRWVIQEGRGLIERYGTSFFNKGWKTKSIAIVFVLSFIETLNYGRESHSYEIWCTSEGI